MSTPAAPIIPLQALITHLLEETFIIRYVTVSVYIVFLLEHLASLPEEIELIWKSSWNLMQCCFLLYRYSTLAGLTVLMHVIAGLSGPLSENFCKHVVAAMVALAIFSMGIADAMVMLRVSVLWGRQRTILVTLFLSFFVTYTIVIVCAALTATKLVSSTVSVPIIDICGPTSKPSALFGVWIPGTAFDILVLSLTSWNACARPRDQQTPLTQALYRDGIAFFIILAGLRTLNLFMTILSGTFFIIGVCMAWPLSAVTLSRLVFHLRHVESRQELDAHEVEYLDDIPHATLEDLPRGSLFHMDRWEAVDTQSQFGGSTAIDSDREHGAKCSTSSHVA